MKYNKLSKQNKMREKTILLELVILIFLFHMSELSSNLRRAALTQGPTNLYIFLHMHMYFFCYFSVNR